MNLVLYPFTRKLTKLTILVFFVFFINSCFTFNQSGSQSSLVIVSVTLEKDEPFINEWMEPTFDNVTIFKGDREISYSKQSGHYYYFQNLTPGQYEIGNLVHLFNKGNGGNSMANDYMPQTIGLPLTREDRLMTVVDIEPGSIVFLGEIQVKTVFRVKSPMEVFAKLNKSISAEKRAMSYLTRNFPRSSWAALAKDRSDSLNIISVGTQE
jgi:hypothetical protein